MVQVVMVKMILWYRVMQVVEIMVVLLMLTHKMFAFACFCNAKLRCSQQIAWKQSQDRLQDKIKMLNKNIDKYNLIVPLLSQQVMHFPLHLEANKALKEGLSKDQIPKKLDEKVNTGKKGFCNFLRFFRNS